MSHRPRPFRAANIFTTDQATRVSITGGQTQFRTVRAASRGAKTKSARPMVPITAAGTVLQR
ncbi:hypothetical protein D9M72_622290 [compost metagenome]